jgi:hypothetical protein
MNFEVLTAVKIWIVVFRLVMSKGTLVATTRLHGIGTQKTSINECGLTYTINHPIQKFFIRIYKNNAVFHIPQSSSDYFFIWLIYIYIYKFFSWFMGRYFILILQVNVACICSNQFPVNTAKN